MNEFCIICYKLILNQEIIDEFKGQKCHWVCKQAWIKKTALRVWIIVILLVSIVSMIIDVVAPCIFCALK